MNVHQTRWVSDYWESISNWQIMNKTIWQDLILSHCQGTTRVTNTLMQVQNNRLIDV